MTDNPVTTKHLEFLEVFAKLSRESQLHFIAAMKLLRDGRLAEYEDFTAAYREKLEARL